MGNLREPNATISSTRAGVAVLPATTRASIGVPGPKDMALHGGQVRYLMLLEPGSDIQASDLVYIQSWGKQTVQPTKPYRVIAADPAGFRELEIVRVPLAERTMR